MDGTHRLNDDRETIILGVANAMLTNFFAKRKLKRQLAKYIRPDAVASFVDGTYLNAPKRKEGRIEFVMVLVHPDDPERLSQYISQISSTCHKHDAVLFNVAGPLALMAFGTQGEVPDGPRVRGALVADLHEQLGNNARIVHGAANAHFGLFGDYARTIHYTFTFNGFESAIANLGQLAFGETRELELSR